MIRHYTACLAIVGMLDAKAPYTTEHSIRVFKMCRLALIMRLTYPQIVFAIIAASAHDIGKVGIPNSILLKEEPLDSHEFDVFKYHPGIGADILKKFTALKKSPQMCGTTMSDGMEQGTQMGRLVQIFPDFRA